MNAGEYLFLLILQSGFWLQAASILLGFSLGCQIGPMIRVRKKRSGLVLFGLSLTAACLTMAGISIGLQGIPQAPDFFMALVWLLFSLIIALFSPWAILSIPVLVLLLIWLVFPKLAGFELLYANQLVSGTPVAALSNRVAGLWSDWEIEHLSLALGAQHEHWRMAVLPVRLHFAVIEFPAPYRLFALPVFSRLDGLRRSDAIANNNLGVKVFLPGASSKSLVSEILNPGILSGYRSVVYLSGRVVERAP